MSDQLREQLLLTLLAEESEELRNQSQAERMYTAASVGSFGAVAWGIAAIPKVIPATAAALGVLIVAGAVIAKIRRGHNNYRRVKESRAKICAQIAVLPNCNDVIPDALMSDKVGGGYLASIAVVVAAAIAAIAFCGAVIVERNS